MLLEQAAGDRGTSAAGHSPVSSKANVTMKYSDGRAIAVGDRVRLWDDQYGVVVCSIDTGEFNTDYPKNTWAYLKSGILIKTDDGELFHYDKSDEDLEFVKSNAPP